MTAAETTVAQNPATSNKTMRAITKDNENSQRSLDPKKTFVPSRVENGIKLKNAK